MMTLPYLNTLLNNVSESLGVVFGLIKVPACIHIVPVHISGVFVLGVYQGTR